MAVTFISYRREDTAGYAGRLRESLERRLGSAEVFRDVDALQPGQDFVQAIESRLASCRVMLVVIGRDWLDAKVDGGSRRLDDPYDFVRLEVAAGLARAEVLVVPVLVEGTSMPAAADLPGDIRPLARRHAVSVRDETWDADVDRLVDVISGPGHGSAALIGPRRSSAAVKWALAGMALIAVVGLAARSWRGVPPVPSLATAPDRTAPIAAGTAAAFPPYAVDVPRVAEVAVGDLVYTLVSANVTSRAAGPELRLRIRLANGGASDVNFWDGSFRLAIGGEEAAPTSGLNEIVSSHSIRSGIVTFLLPPNPRRAVLRVIGGQSPADLPLDLTQTGRPAADEQPEVADSRSQAIVRGLTREPEFLMKAGDVRITLERVTSRRFVNALRLMVTARIENRGRYPISSDQFIVRVVTGDDVIAPWTAPGDPIAGMSTSIVSSAFDLSPAAHRITLRTTFNDQSVERALELE